MRHICMYVHNRDSTLFGGVIRKEVMHAVFIIATLNCCFSGRAVHVASHEINVGIHDGVRLCVCVYVV